MFRRLASQERPVVKDRDGSTKRPSAGPLQSTVADRPKSAARYRLFAAEKRTATIGTAQLAG